MLTIIVPGIEGWDEKTERFVDMIPDKELKLEHSLVSVSKWEAKWHKPFLSVTEFTPEELIDYVRCMTVTQNVSEDVYLRLTKDNYLEIQKYMDDPMTATWFGKSIGAPKKPNPYGFGKKVITSEVIYYWMISYNIPVEFQKWHFSRLMTLIRVFNEENKPKGKVNKQELAAQKYALNEQRKAMLHSNG